MKKCSQNRIIVLFYSKILDIYHTKNLQTLALWACGFKDLYKNEILEKIIEVMLKRITREGGNATDYSRLGWLLLNINNRDKAE